MLYTMDIPSCTIWANNLHGTEYSGILTAYLYDVHI